MHTGTGPLPARMLRDGRIAPHTSANIAAQPAPVP
jgi:hypothetical protein